MRIRRNSTSSPTVSTAPNAASAPVQSVTVWLPKDRSMVQRVLEVYFTRLNIHRPVLIRSSFERSLDELYQGTSPTIDQTSYTRFFVHPLTPFPYIPLQYAPRAL